MPTSQQTSLEVIENMQIHQQMRIIMLKSLDWSHMHFKFTLSLLLAWLFALTPQFAFADDLKVGVAVGATINTTPKMGVQVSEAVGAALEAQLKVSAVAGSGAQSMLPEEAKAETCFGDSACLVQAGKALQVDQLLMLIVVGLGEQIKIEATWVDIASGETALRPALTLSTAPEAMSKELLAQAKKLLPDADLRKPLVVNDPAPSDPDIVEASPRMRPATGKHLTGLSTALFIGGGLAFVGSVSYGGYRLVKCDGRDCGTSKNFNTAADLTGAVGLVSLSIASYLYFTSGEAESPVALQVDDDSFTVAFGGQF